MDYKEQLQVRLNTNFQYEAIMLTICLKGKGTVFKGPKIPNSSETKESLGRSGFTLVALVVNSHQIGQH